MILCTVFLLMTQLDGPYEKGRKILLNQGASAAIEYFEELTITENDPKAMYYLGWSLYEDGNQEEAQVIARFLIDKEPGDRFMGHSYYLLGVIANEKADPIAIQHFEEAEVYYLRTTSFGSLYRTRCGMAAALIVQERFLEAQTHLNYAIRYRKKSKKPENTAYYHELLSRVFFGLGDYEAALEEANESHQVYEKLGDSVAATYTQSSIAFFEILTGRAEAGIERTKKIDDIIYSVEDEYKKLSFYNGLNWIIALRCSGKDYTDFEHGLRDKIADSGDQLLKKHLDFALTWNCGQNPEN